MDMGVQKPRVLIIEDEAIIALNISRILESRGYEVADTLSSGKEALESVVDDPPDCVLMDIVLTGEMDGIETAGKISGLSDVPIIYLTAHTDDETLQRAKETGPYGYVVKPINPEELISTVEISLFKHQTGKKVRESEERYRSFVENFQGIAFQYGIDFSPVFFHGAVAEITGYSEDDFLACAPSWERIIHPEDVAAIRVGNDRLKSEPGIRLHRDYRIMNAGGSIRWVDEYIQNTSPSKGGAAVLRGVILDVTERKLAEEIIREKTHELVMLNEELNGTIEELESTNEEFEEQNRELIMARNELERSESFLRSIFRAAPVGIGIVVNRVFGWTNEMIHRMTGYSEEGLSGRSARMLYPDDEEFEFVGREKYKQIQQYGTGTVETRWKKKDGTIIDVLLSSTPLNPEDLSRGVTFTAMDITERKKTERDLLEARRAWEDIFQAIGHPTFILDREYKIISANRAAQAALKKSEVDIIGSKCYTLFHHSISEPENCPMKCMIDKGEMASAEMVIEALNGVYLVSCTPVKDQEGRVEKIIHIAMDISDRKRAENELKRLNAILENTSDLVSISTLNADITYLNKAGFQMLGYSQDIDIRNKKIRDLHPSTALKIIEEEGIPTALRDGVWEGETAIINTEGGEIPVSQVIIAHRDESGKPVYLSTTMRDISQQRIAAAALRENEMKLRNIVEHSTNAFFSHTPDHVLTYASPQFHDILGYNTGDLMRKWTDLVTDNPINKFGLIRTERAIETGERQPPYELELLHRDGRKIYIEVHEAPVVVEGKTIAMVGALTDITERKRAETALLMSEERYRNLVETMRDGMVVLDVNGLFTYVNPRACEMFGYTKEELLGKNPFDFLDDKNRALMAKQLEKRKEGTIDIYELEWPRPDGVTVLILVSPKVMYDDQGNFAGSFGVITDITERRRAEELMLQNEKMMTIGSLAAGMAHEINNPLGIILQGVQAAQLKLSTDFEVNRTLAGEIGIDMDKLGVYLEKSDILTYLDGIAKAGMRASEIVTSMLQFSRRSSGQKIKSDLHELIERTIEMASRDYDLKKKYDFKKITLDRDYYEGMPHVECVPMEIEQVLLNLLKNAAHAISEKNDAGYEARIGIKTGTEGEFAIIEVSDNGTGIDDYTRKHIFEPFYTTKGPGEGTGLGLAVSFFIISKNHGGTITVNSLEGEGTTFIIRLPLGGIVP